MPDFEALIRHQQLKQPNTYQRLKVVDSPNLEKDKTEQPEVTQTGLMISVFGGFIGSLIGTISILFLYLNEYLPMDLLKIK